MLDRCNAFAACCAISRSYLAKRRVAGRRSDSRGIGKPCLDSPHDLRREASCMRHGFPDHEAIGCGARRTTPSKFDRGFHAPRRHPASSMKTIRKQPMLVNGISLVFFHDTSEARPAVIKHGAAALAVRQVREDRPIAPDLRFPDISARSRQRSA
jgi:hypothetical protein